VPHGNGSSNSSSSSTSPPRERQCANVDNAIVEEDKCPDVDGECRKFGKDCVKCLSANKGCIYCNTGVTFGISSGQCSAGVDGLGKVCNAVGIAIKIVTKYADAAACPGSPSNNSTATSVSTTADSDVPSTASTVVASLAAVVMSLAMSAF